MVGSVDDGYFSQGDEVGGSNPPDSTIHGVLAQLGRARSLPSSFVLPPLSKGHLKESVMRKNVKAETTPSFTAEGGRAANYVTAYQQLRRSVLSCLLWEDEFYENGETVADRIEKLAVTVTPPKVAALAIEARSEYNLRHVPLLLLCALAKTASGTSLVSDTIYKVIQRPDELTELLAIYWRKGKTPISAQMKKGLARAFTKFSANGLSKYNRDNVIKLRDVLFLTHPTPKDEEQAITWKALVDKTLAPADTWEVALSGGGNKKESFERLLREEKLGYLALLRNVRTMMEVGVDRDLVVEALIARRNGAERVLPFRYVAAARACPQLDTVIDKALVSAIDDLPILKGSTVLLVDVSGSMRDKLSGKSELSRMDAAATLASIVNGSVRVFTFSDKLVEVPPRRGMAGVDVITQSQPHGGTHLAQALTTLKNSVTCDRIIVITDEQSHDGIIEPFCDHAYLINVASNKNGIGYGKWVHIDGFSEQVLRFIMEYET